MYYGSGTADIIASGQPADTTAYAACRGICSSRRRVEAACALHEMTAWPPSWNYDISEIWLYQSMHIYLKTNPVKFHPDPIFHDGCLSSDMGSLPDPKKSSIICSNPTNQSKKLTALTKVIIITAVLQQTVYTDRMTSRHTLHETVELTQI